jgi:amidase
MNLTEYSSYDGLGLAELVRNREVSAEQVCNLALAAMERLNPALNFVVQTYPERASALRNKPPPPGELGGVPTLLKDLYKFEKGCLSEGGSELTRGLVGPYDSELVQRMRRTGLVTLGRSTVPEMGWASSCNTRLQGCTRNPWNPDTWPGGSSSGAAVAVASGSVPIAAASDSGGSTRGPAACNGLVGLKPTRGRVSDGPGAAEPNAGMGAQLAVTRTVRDTAAILDALQGPAVGDPFLAPGPERPFLEELGRSPRRLSIAFTTRAFDGGTVDPEIELGVVKTLEVLRADGHEVREAAPPLSWEPFLHAMHVIFAAGMMHGCDHLGALAGRRPSPDNLMRTNWAMYQYGRTVSATSYLAALDEFNSVRRQTGAFFERFDLLVTPTCTQLALPHAVQDQDQEISSAEDWSRHIYRPEVFQPLFNVTGQPAISLPLHQATSGLPIGIQFAGRIGEDALLIQLAAVLERALPWRGRRPPIHAATCL